MRIYSDNKELILKLVKSCPNITEAAKEFAKKLEIEYSDNVRRCVSAVYNSSIKKRVINKEDGIKRLVITSAQNNAYVDQGFLGCILNYCNEENAKLIVGKVNYRNPTSIKESEKKKLKEFFDPALRPFLVDDQFLEISKSLMMFRGYVQPTAELPLTGFESITKEKSGILPHPKIQLNTIPTPGNRTPKVLVTTGSITKEQYSLSKAGIKGDHHHIMGALVVEIRNNKVFHIRHIVYDGVGFYDMVGGNVKYYFHSKSKEGKISTYICGDKHFPFHDPVMQKLQLKLINSLNPDEVVLHDVLDFYNRNHHERSNRFMNYAKTTYNTFNVEKEVHGVIDHIVDFRKKAKRTVKIVRSNHDNALDKWLMEENLRDLGENSKFFHYMSYLKCCHSKKLDTGEVYVPQALSVLLTKMKLFDPKDLIDEQNEFIKNDILYSHHGHNGANGSRGSLRQFSKYGIKTWTAHTHSPSILRGSYCVGHNMVPRMYASGGASSWDLCDGITYPNGKRTLLFYNKEYKSFYL